ncbi:MAG: efflux RND transporter periplasmic adaptor subunit [Parvularculaceae bacterium]
MIRKFFVLFGTLAIIVFFAAVIVLMGKMRPEQEQKQAVVTNPAVFVTAAEYQDIRLSAYAQGEVKPRTEINLTTQVGGKVVKVSDNFIDGGIITKGDTLIKIEDADYRVAVAQARAQVAQAEQGFRLEQAEAELARRDWEELGGLQSGETPSSLTLREPQLAQAKANFDAAKANLRNAQLNLSRTTIKAPFTGRVRSRMADLGQFVSPGFGIARIFATDVAEIRLPMSDNDLSKLGLPIAFVSTKTTPGPNVIISASVAGANHTWAGQIVRTDAAYDPGTRQISAIAAVKDPYGAGSDDGFPLAVGLFVSAEIEGAQFAKAVVLPRIALSGQGTVFIVNDDLVVVEKQITVVAITERGVIVTAGLEEGDLVITSRLSGIGPGEEVTPLDAKGKKIFKTKPAKKALSANDNEDNDNEEEETETTIADTPSTAPGGQQ